MPSYPRVLSPTRIGSMELSNRLVMAPVTTTYATDELLPSERLVEFLEERAQGGVGLITLEACTVDRRHREVPRCMHFSSDDVVPAHRALTERIHAHAAAGGGGPVRVQPQLAHPGPDALSPYLDGIPNVGPSVIQSYLTGTPSRALSEKEVGEVVAQFGVAARRVREAGYDGLELHAAHAYMLLGSFLSPLRNRRSDAYTGATDEGRVRIVVEVLEAIAREAGADFPVTLRISGFERVPGGRSIEDTQRIAPLLAEAGVACFHVSGGVIDRLTSQIVTGSAYGNAHNAAAAAAVRRVVDVPVMTVGRVHDPRLAEEVLVRGDADLVAMARPLLADPELPRKLAAGRDAEVRRCISCETCIDSMEHGSMACAVNGRSGREGRLPVAATGRARRVLVVGGGTAGLEAARIAALRGHRVTLVEKSARLGGSLFFAATVHPENEPQLDFLLREVARLPIDVRTATEATRETIAGARPDVVVVATGGRVVAPDVPGAGRTHTVTGPLLRAMLAGRPADAAGALRLPAWQRAGARALGLRLAGLSLGRFLSPGAVRSLTSAWMPLGRRVAVVGADLAGTELAEFLAERGRTVALLERGPAIAPEVGLKRRTEHMDRLDALQVSVNTGVEVDEITPGGLTLRRGAGRPHALEVDSVVLSGEVQPDTRLFEATRALGLEAHAIGDCTGLGLIHKAIAEATRVASAL